MIVFRSFFLGCAASLILSLSFVAAAPADPAAAFSEVEALLAAHGPSASNIAARHEIAKRLDELVRVHVTRRMSAEEVKNLVPIRDFHLRQVDRGLDALERAEVKEGVQIFKFYSSSMVIKSPMGVIAIDFQEGPLPDNRAEPEATRVGRQTGFHWTPDQRERLARMVDVSLITHKDYDHASYSLSKRLLEQGKPVIVPEQLRLWWSDLSDRLTVPPYQKPFRVGPVEIFVMQGRQMSEEAAGLDFSAQPLDEIPGRETNVYLIKVNEMVFLQAAENGVPIGEGLQAGIDAGFRPDVYFSLGASAGRASVVEVMKKVGPAFLIPIHEYEMTHGGGGNRTGGWFTPARRNLIKKGRAMPLFWGENFHLTPAMFPWKVGNQRAGHCR